MYQQFLENIHNLSVIQRQPLAAIVEESYNKCLGATALTKHVVVLVFLPVSWAESSPPRSGCQSLFSINLKMY